MKIKNFFKKYGLIIGLVVLVLFLVFLKFGPKTEKQNTNIKTVIISPTPIPTKILPQNPEDVSLKELKQMNDEELSTFMEGLTLDEILSLPEEDVDYPLDYLLPHEEADFKVIKYIKPGVLLVEAKNKDANIAKESLKKWLNKYEETPGENIVVWQ